MANIKFADYFVDKMIYQENPNYDLESSKSLEVSLSPTVDIAFDDDLVLVIFSVEIGDFDNDDCPFVIDIELKAFFEFDVTDDPKDVQQLHDLLSQNAVAILYPYIRSLVSDLTLRSNKFPAYVLPTINVVKLMASRCV
uniref:Preprotein translocase subunit SecB n=1 Tax=Candidatus Enterococcus clewellii TaxID=1834193 RepID=A0A242JZ73_9ENTE|nr:protein-export chaperone SecB [Enterococcus sp. 9E7_DIV0242]OTP10619.1 hypothetical protein A5888_003917 [Enterococcus sp. 9E7_DIV0242]